MIPPIAPTTTDDFRAESTQIQLKLTSHIDQTINSLVVKFNLNCFAYSRALKLQVIEQISNWNLNKEARPKIQGFLESFAMKVSENLRDFAREHQGLPNFKDFIVRPIILEAQKTRKTKDFVSQQTKDFVSQQSNSLDKQRIMKACNVSISDSSQSEEEIEKIVSLSSSSSSSSQQQLFKRFGQSSRKEESNSSSKPYDTKTKLDKISDRVGDKISESAPQKKVCQILYCPLCEREFYRQISTLQHILENHRVNNDTGYRCFLCERQDTDSENLSFHMASAHTQGAPQKLIDKLAADVERTIEEQKQKKEKE